MLTGGGGDIRSSTEHVVSGNRAGALDRGRDDEFIAGADRSGIHKALIAMDHARVIKAKLRVMGDAGDRLYCLLYTSPSPRDS